MASGRDRNEGLVVGMANKSIVIRLGKRRVGDGCPAFIIAEAGINHEGDLDTALRMVDTAAALGADAVKFQVFTPEEVVSPEAVVPAGGPGRASRRLVNVLRDMELRETDIRSIKSHCDERGIAFLATPFDISHVRLLSELDVVAIKVGSGDVTNLPMIEAIARTRRPVVLSTGMSTIGEIDAPTALLRARRIPHALLHCVSSYPAGFEGLRLRAMASLRRRYRVPVGFSDHTPGVEASVAAVALGASIIEKHFTLDRNRPGADHAMSLEPSELETLVRSIRNVEAALQGDRIGFIGPEMDIRAAARRSIVARVAIHKGQTIKAGMLAVRRPANGLDPRMWGEVVGAKAARDVPANAPLQERDIEG